MTTIAGINLDGFEEALGGSSEEAAKKFLEIAGIGIGQVVADAMDQALNSTVGAGNPQDWVVLIGPCFLNVSFTVPEGTQPRRINTIATPSTSALGGDVKGSISVSLKIEF